MPCFIPACCACLRFTPSLCPRIFTSIATIQKGTVCLPFACELREWFLCCLLFIWFIFRRVWSSFSSLLICFVNSLLFPSFPLVFFLLCLLLACLFPSFLYCRFRFISFCLTSLFIYSFTACLFFSIFFVFSSLLLSSSLSSSFNPRYQ